MREFFRGSKRKWACFLALVSTAFMLGWIRSIYFDDQFGLSLTGKSEVLFVSTLNNLVLACVAERDTYAELGRRVNWITVPIQGGQQSFLQTNDAWDLRIGQFRFAFENDGAALCVPYWSIVTPLILLSAWMLFSKRQQPDPAPLAKLGDEEQLP